MFGQLSKNRLRLTLLSSLADLVLMMVMVVMVMVMEVVMVAPSFSGLFLT